MLSSLAYIYISTSLKSSRNLDFLQTMGITIKTLMSFFPIFCIVLLMTSGIKLKFCLACILVVIFFFVLIIC